MRDMIWVNAKLKIESDKRTTPNPYGQGPYYADSQPTQASHRLAPVRFYTPGVPLSFLSDTLIWR